MYQFYIVEIQKTNGEYGHIVHYAYDVNERQARLKAESKYYEVLSAAAISDVDEHSAIMFGSDGVPIMNKFYIHRVSEPTEEVEE